MARRTKRNDVLGHIQTVEVVHLLRHRDEVMSFKTLKKSDLAHILPSPLHQAVQPSPRAINFTDQVPRFSFFAAE
jgi:hypothetical protein